MTIEIKNKQLELPEGIFYRNNKAGVKVEITAKGKKGYIIIEERSGNAHRLIAQYLLGELTNRQFVDHIDGNPSNNHLSNLRLVSHKENQWNKTLSKTGDFNIVKKENDKNIVVFNSLPEAIPGMTKCKTTNLFYSKTLSYEKALELRNTCVQCIKKHLDGILTFEQIFNEIN